MSSEDMQEILNLLDDLQGDNTVPRNVKAKLQAMKEELSKDGIDLSLVVNKVLADVEEIANDINLPMFIRTQIWNLTSMLESLNAEV